MCKPYLVLETDTTLQQMQTFAVAYRCEVCNLSTLNLELVEPCHKAVGVVPRNICSQDAGVISTLEVERQLCRQPDVVVSLLLRRIWEFKFISARPLVESICVGSIYLLLTAIGRLDT